MTYNVFSGTLNPTHSLTLQCSVLTYAVDDVVVARQAVFDARRAQILLAHVASARHVQSEEDPARLLARRDRQLPQLLLDSLHERLQLSRPSTHTHTHARMSSIKSNQIKFFCQHKI